MNNIKKLNKKNYPQSHTVLKIFVVSLQRSKDRRKSIQSQMKKFGLDFEFIDAVDGNKLTPQQNSRVSRFWAWLRLGRKITNGEIGCAISHANIYEKIVDENIDEAIILEDDVILTKQFADFVKNKTFNKINKDFIFLFSDTLFYKSCKKFSKNITLYKPYVNPTHTVAYYLTNKMANGLHKHTKTINYVADYPVLLTSIGDVAVIKPDIVRHDEFESNIEIERDKYIGWFVYIRRVYFLSYIFNMKLYGNLCNYINNEFLHKNKYKD